MWVMEDKQSVSICALRFLMSLEHRKSSLYFSPAQQVLQRLMHHSMHAYWRR